MTGNEKVTFQEGESILCYHGPLLYEAKALKSELRNKVTHYLIHYSGWNKSWDEWVPHSRVLKLSDENLKKQQELFATHGTTASKLFARVKPNARKSSMGLGDDRSETSDKMSTEGDSSHKKRKKYEDTDYYVKKSDIKITLPDELKQILADDYHAVNSGIKAVVLPAEYSVEMLLDNYTKYKLDNQFDKNIIVETVEGIKDYFNAVLQTKLLYKAEKHQSAELLKNNKKPTQIYGTIHFLRLFVKIGELLSYSYWDEICVKQLTLHIENVVDYLNENRSSLFNPQKVYIEK